MSLKRLGLILLAVYLVFVVGGFANNFPELRWFNHAFMTCLMGGWLAWRVYRDRNLPKAPLNIIVFALLGLGFLSVPFSESPRMALEYMWLPVVFAVVYFFIVNAFHHAQHKFILEIVYFVTAVVVFLSFLQIGSVFFGWGIVRSAGQGWINFIGQGVPLPWQQDMRIFLPLGISTQVAGFVAPVIIITLSWILWAKQQNRALWILLFVLLSIILFLTFSRGGLISLAVGLFSFLVLYLVGNERFSRLLTPRNVVIGIVTLIVLAVLGNSVVSLASIGSRITGDQARFNLWNSAVEMIADNPVTGVGTGLYGRTLREYRDVTVADDRLSTAHNIYLNVASENGIGIFLVLIGAISIIGWQWWKLRQQTQITSERWYLLMGILAGLIGFAVHNLFDTLNVFGSMLLVTVMVVYVTVQPAESRLAPLKNYGHRIVATSLLLIVVGYGIWFLVIVDRAHWHFVNSVRSSEDAITQVEHAVAIDPAVNLYTLRLTYLRGWEAHDNPTHEALDNAILAHQEAIALEPTWTTGIWNLASLYELYGNTEQALVWATRARELSTRQSGDGQWAYFAELHGQVADDDVIQAYITGLQQASYLPLSTFWVETDLRTIALSNYLDLVPVDRQYRIARVHFPNELADYIPETPQTASEWWVVGEQAIMIEDSAMAIEAFSNAIDLSPANGDYYASRARGFILAGDIYQALDDLNTARFLSTRDEYPNAIEADITENNQQRRNLLETAIPAFFLSENFEAVVYNGRRAQFIPYDSVRPIGRGDDALQPYYELINDYQEEGEIETMTRIYQLLRLYAPEDDTIRDAIADLE